MDTNIIRFNRVKRQVAHLLSQVIEFAPSLKASLSEFEGQDKILSLVPALQAELVEQKKHIIALNQLLSLITEYDKDRADLEK